MCVGQERLGYVMSKTCTDVYNVMGLIQYGPENLEGKKIKMTTYRPKGVDNGRRPSGRESHCLPGSRALWERDSV